MVASPASATSTEASQSSAADASTGEQSVVLQQELLSNCNARLDTVEQDMETVRPSICPVANCY